MKSDYLYNSPKNLLSTSKMYFVLRTKLLNQMVITIFFTLQSKMAQKSEVCSELVLA